MIEQVEVRVHKPEQTAPGLSHGAQFVCPGEAEIVQDVCKASRRINLFARLRRSNGRLQVNDLQVINDFSDVRTVPDGCKDAMAVVAQAADVWSAREMSQSTFQKKAG